MRNTLIFTTLTAIAAAQTITDLPACSLQCLATATGGLNCGLTNFACSCQKADQLTPVVTPCVQQACTDAADQRKTIEVLSGICAAAGFPIEVPAPPASSAAAEPTSEPTPEPTSSEASVETQPYATEEPEYSEYPTATETASEYSAPTYATDDVPSVSSSYSDLIPLSSLVDTVIVSRPSPHLTSFPGVLPPYPTDTPAPSVPAPSGTGTPPSATSSHLPEFTGAAAAVQVNVVAAGMFGLAAFVL
ncbi:hypothetical protein BU25DRAFT_414823 [Macroventuria anomochaeta]|uniref:Uncharacterized protein n=1 Tax=Macroventuria anomochaeta TaxID=301207 RepID=A0ACB6RLM5_9PLEO|nr:uncharacterized protein BU25DRAFT_414823 [Macroventuria anomochaeta]KAF2622830.1 hypothetical protein BU25DRAFT_414823 [Macroventuria anomochaeta]